MSQKVVVDESLCIGCGICQGISDGEKDGYFKLEDISQVVKEYDEADKDIIEEAITSCPVSAISLE